MFNHQMVLKEIDHIFNHTCLVKTAAFEAMINTSNANEEMAEHKMNDLEQLSKELSKKLAELKIKIEFMKSQS